ncbi:hypothetical protein Ctob_006837 [Chrysochromulina tobinii]|uniref:Uncharacterized protein n=1 Tax=Chrysochromulina tobinii TaxID=1460289 RepID=A0A0M0K3D4_9EUKA|nr:hypothetical protein Ctob_006837 [Chrysochromulina tobinii]|eukprot:KOO33102.1 hypothetical protein Ctob_006837 [Chrysochromulina sp. CCMP291]
MLVRPAGSVIDVIDVSSRNAPSGTCALPSRSTHAASSTSIGISPSPRMHARTPAIGYGGGPSSYSSDPSEDATRLATRLSAATSTSKPPSPVTFARLGSQRDASAASTKRRLAARLSERLSSVTLARLLVSGRPTRAHSRAHRTRRARARHARLTPLSAQSVSTSASARASSRASSLTSCVESQHTGAGGVGASAARGAVASR